MKSCGCSHRVLEGGDEELLNKMLAEVNGHQIELSVHPHECITKAGTSCSGFSFLLDVVSIYCFMELKKE